MGTGQGVRPRQLPRRGARACELMSEAAGVLYRKMYCQNPSPLHTKKMEGKKKSHSKKLKQKQEDGNEEQDQVLEELDSDADEKMCGGERFIHRSVRARAGGAYRVCSGEQEWQ